MDIIKFLEKDHDKLRRELVRIKNNLAGGTARDEVKAFISFLELHESVEDEILFPQLGELSRELAEDNPLPGAEEQHDKIWGLLNQLMDSLDERQFGKLQEAFFKFCASAEAHFGYEERVLFPTVKKLLDAKTLEGLGTKAEKRFARFSFV